MALPRPSLLLILDIDKRIDSKDLRLEIDRCYAYVGSALVRTHEPESEDTPIENTMRLMVRLGTRHYIDSAEEESDELWNTIMRRWFKNQFHKLGNQTLIYNKRQQDVGNDKLAFTWFEIELEGGKLVVQMRANDVSSIDEEAAEVLTTIRDAYNAGTLGDKQKVVRIITPASESWKAQVVAGEAAAKKRAEEEAKAAEAAKKLQEEKESAAETAAERAFLESPELIAQQAETGAMSASDAVAAQQAAQAGTNNTSQGGGVESPELEFKLEEPTFNVAYDTFCVVYDDGSKKVLTL